MEPNANEPSNLTTTGMLPSASVLLLAADDLLRLETFVLSSEWWIVTLLSHVDDEERFTYDCGVLEILDSHGRTKCEGLTHQLPCVICNVKHDNANYGAWVKTLGERLTPEPRLASVELDGFDPNVYTESELREMAQEALNRLLPSSKAYAYTDPVIEMVENKLRKDGQLFHD